MEEQPSSIPPRSKQSTWYYLFFFLSGLTALVYETAFVRQLQLIFGSTLSAVSVVVAVFFGGLAIGAALIGPRADQYSPLRLYGILEIGTGLWAIVAVVIIPVVRSFYASLTSTVQLPVSVHTLLQAIMSILILLPATILMGATLPALSRGLTRNAAKRFRSISTLYGINTIGATTGTILCGFFLLEHLGYLKTIVAAMAVNFLIGGAAILLSPKQHQEGITRRQPGTKASIGAARPREHRLRMVLISMAAISGFAALGYEVVWFRTLAFSVVTDTYAFAIMLGVYLLGIGGGSMIAARRFHRTRHENRDARKWFELGVLEIAATVMVALGFSILVWLNTSLPRPAVTNPAYWVSTLGNITLQAIVLILPATLIFGYVFPLMVSLYAGSIRQLARQVGRITAVNTAGAIAGSLAAGFILIPLVGIQWALLVLMGLSSMLAVMAFLFGPLRRRQRITGATIASAVILGILIFFPIRPHFGFRQIPSYEKAELLFYHEGADGTVMVTQDKGDRSIRRLLINQQQATSTYLPGQRKNQLMGHLPLWACSGAKNALVICFGSGGTFGALGLYELDRVDCVEISAAVLDAASYFTEWNGNVLERKNVNIIIDDGRSYLLTTRDTYDIITLEPMHPGLKGVSSLYSLEFYEEARKRLNTNGVLCQWIPLYSMSGQDARSLLATALTVFPQSSLWIVGSEGILLCARDSLTINWSWMMKHMSNPTIKQTLKKVYLDNFWTLLSGYLLGPQGLHQYTSNVALVLDDRPHIEYSIPRHQHIFPWNEILGLAAKRESPINIITGISQSTREALNSTWMVRKKTWAIRDQGFAAIAQGDHGTARVRFEHVYANDPQDRYAVFFLKEIYWRYGVELSRRQRWQEAVALYKRAVLLEPDDPRGHFYLGVALYNAGQTHEAVTAIGQALTLQPDLREAQEFLQEINDPQKINKMSR
jgi:spermidine synthase